MSSWWRDFYFCPFKGFRWDCTLSDLEIQLANRIAGEQSGVAERIHKSFPDERI